MFTAASGTLSAEELAATGWNADNGVDVFSLNFYYDIPVRAGFKPFIGIGPGFANIEHARNREPALVFSLGGLYEISDGFRLGIKYQYIGIDEFEDQLLIPYKNVNAHTISATIRLDL